MKPEVRGAERERDLLGGEEDPPLHAEPNAAEGKLFGGTVQTRPSRCSNMETELFMECEEEELEPWQQVDDSVEEDDFMDFGEPVEDCPSPLPDSETPPPTTPPPAAASPPRTASSCEVVPPPVSTLSSSSSSSPLCLPVEATPSASAPPMMAPTPPLILTQTSGGTFLLPAGSGSRQPIFLTAQGFQLPTVMNSGAPLVLNLQPGQMVQPLTLIQSPSLGQLVRPVSAVQPRLGQAPSGGPALPGSTFATMQLPTTLTLCTSTGNLTVTQMSGTNTLKLATSPALPSGSAIGGNRATPPSSAPGPAPSAAAAPPAASREPPRVVMSVEQFYYGTFEGDLSLRKSRPAAAQTAAFVCQICSHQAESNLRLMQHTLQHSELTGGGATDKHCCRFCYRQFSSPAQLQNHQDQVHGPAPSTCMCRICEWAFENEPAFLNHMKSNHKPGEMPYTCQVCFYRSSFYSDVLQHFASFHRESCYLLCVFCLKVTRNPVSYQQHLLRHQVSQAFHCNRCRLQFVLLKDKMQHKLESHRSFRRPKQLEGLPPGSKVTIRTYGKVRPQATSSRGRLLQSPASLIQPIKIKTESQKPALQKSPAAPNRRSKSPSKRVRKDHPGRRSSADGPGVCLECGTIVWDFSAHYPTHVHCLLCPYSSCCSRAYASHMIQHHLPHSKDKVLPLHRRPPPCVFVLRCSHCDFRSQTGDQMAEHLLQSDHDSATCSPFTFVEQDLKFCVSEEQLPPDEEPEQNQDLPDSSWRSADSWRDPAELADAPPSVRPFNQTSGPNPNLPRNGDAIDFFDLLFPAALVELIVRETNGHVKTCSFLGCGTPGWVPVTASEIKGFLGLVILMGIQNLPDPSQYWSLTHYDCSYTFHRTMSFRRFQQIAEHVRMGSFLTNELRGAADPTDPLHVFRPMMALLGDAMWSAYTPNCGLTIDRALLPSMEEDWGPSRRPQTQPQVWLLCDSRSGYCHRLFFQVGGKGGADLGSSVVPQLVQDLENKHHQLYLANSLASAPLMLRLLERGVYASSSFPPPNPILPRELWESGRLEKPGDFLQRQCGLLLATRWRDTKRNGLPGDQRAAGEPDVVWRRSQTKPGGLDPIHRPLAFRLLQENMRGVDICKQLLACNPLGAIVNAFIVLRESRKENPPPWVQDGLFTQVSFRRRLGNQLAKCAQKHVDGAEACSPRRAGPEEPAQQRHSMTKISSTPRRCQNCSRQNRRRDSVHGCLACGASLCGEPRCFWEFHGLSPLNKGSTKVGFLRDAVSGAVDVDDGAEDLDPAMAPVEDLDYSEDEKPDEPQDADRSGPVTETAPPSPSATAPREQEDVLSARRLRVVLFALCNGLQPAARAFATEPRSSAPLLAEGGQEAREAGGADGGRRLGAHGGVGAVHARAAAAYQRGRPVPAGVGAEEQRGVRRFLPHLLRLAVSFLLQHRLGARRPARAPARPPPLLEEKVSSFRGFTRRVVRDHALPRGRVAAMDELCVFLDRQLVLDPGRRAEALEFSGSVPAVTVFLTVLADGTALPSLLLTGGPLPRRAAPDHVLLEAGPEAAPAEDALELWTSKVWLPHVLGQRRKSVLVLDRHREHLGEPFLTSTAGCRSLLAVVPAGCSCWLQPVEVCLKPALQRLLLARWAAFTAGDAPRLQEAPPSQLYADVVGLLVDWLVEALQLLKNLPHLWRESFHLTGLLPPPREEPEEPPPKLEEAQANLLKALMKELLGEDSPEKQESEEESEEDQGEGGKEEVTEEQKEVEQDHVTTGNGGGLEEEMREEEMREEEMGERR
ncbi:hypothetical protein OJAV_G00164050 [Oryzias javanicus]|uniref:C2H2-type domain-containing protein n=1 Tax=Oryzias javanicus TaxID=123683 RepID=A0A437CKN5_ORYJA|nr:hypothetical protein OJAV_G00164050 [Oryzias javanicus]